MNKLLSVILLLSLSLALGSCSDDNKEDDKFVWNGDWNDPSDPNYKEGGYNPIEGYWKSDADGKKGLYYSEDFKIYNAYFHSSTYIETSLWRGSYVINDKAYMATNNEKWRYKIEGNVLKITYEMNRDDDWRSYTRVEK